MTNQYFNHDNPLTRHTNGRAEEVNGVFEAIAAGFDLLPDADEFGENQYVQDTGAANAYVVTLDPNPLSYYEGLRLLMKAANANTAASTINANGIGVKTIKRYNGDDLQASDITAGMIVYLIYDGTNFRIVSAHGADVALAQSWATSTSVVSGGLKGARGYAQDASTSASAASSSASSASSSASSASSSASSASSSAASALSQYQGFIGIYYGAFSSDPTLDPLGNALGAGDLYFNTSTGRLRVYSGSAWADAATTHTHAASDITSGTFADARIAQSNVTQHQAALSVATSQLTGTLPDARVAQSNVTQHQAALSIAGSQVNSGTVPEAQLVTSGSFTGTLTGFASGPSGTVNWRKVGHLVTLSVTSNIHGTSNSNSMTMTGMPSSIQPNIKRTGTCVVTDNGSSVIGGFDIAANNTTITFFVGNFAFFTTSSTKGIPNGFHITYAVTT